MSQTDLSQILQQIELLSLEEKRILSNHLASSEQLKQESNSGERLKIIEEHRTEIKQIAKNYGASNLRYVLESTEVIFLVDLAAGRTLFDLGGLLTSLRELLGFELLVFTEKMIKQPYQAQLLRQSNKL
jgi:predicted nucleotidyltransferase